MIGLVLLPLLATLGEGGGSPTGLLVWHAGLVLLVLVELVRGRHRGTCEREWPIEVLVPGTLFLFLALIGVARAPYAYGGLTVALELAAWVAAAHLAACAGPQLIGRLAGPLMLGAALESSLGVFQVLSAGAVRPAGTFLNPNHLALWLVVVLLLGLGRALHARGVERAALVTLAGAVVVGIALARSRGAALALLAGGASLAAASWHRIPRTARVAAAALGALALAAVAALSLARLADYDPFRYHRVRIWTASLAVLGSEPLGGTGPGQFESASANQRFADGEGPLRYDRIHTTTHSDLLRVPVEFGAPAALALGLALALAARRLWLLRRRGALPAEADGALAALLAVGVTGLVDNPSTWPAVYLLAAILWGSLLCGARSTGAAARSTSRGLALGLAALLVLVFAAVDGAPYLAWSQARGLPRGELDGPALGRLGRALELNPLHPGYWLHLAEHRSEVALTAEEHAAAREAAEHALRLDPKDARFAHGLARVEARACRKQFPTEPCREHAAASFLRAEELSRYDPSIPIELAAFLLDTGDPTQARRAAERALAIEPEAVLPRLLLADALIEGGGGAASLRRAAALLDEAGEKAEAGAAWLDGAYASRLLVLDRGAVERLRRKIVRATGDGGAGA